MILRAFIDDSTAADAPYFVLAGYVATVDQWERFTAQWDHALIGLRLPYFKMSEANLWSVEKKKEILPYLQQIIAQNVQFGVQVVVDRFALKEIFPPNFIGYNFSSPYYFAFFQVLRKILTREVWPGGGDKIEFIFDEQMTEKRYIKSVWNNVYDQAPPIVKDRLVGEPQFRNDKEFLPLQAADFKAWWVQHTLSAQFNGNSVSGPVFKSSFNVLVMQSIWEYERLVEYKHLIMDINRVPRVLDDDTGNSFAIRVGNKILRIGLHPSKDPTDF